MHNSFHILYTNIYSHKNAAVVQILKNNVVKNQKTEQLINTVD